MSETAVTTPNELEIRVERVFDAPRAHVYSVWTDPQLIPEWWGDGTVVEEMDVRPGGMYRFRTAHGMVEGEKSGREMRYRLNVERLDRVTRSLGELAATWDQRLMRIKQIAETAAAKQPKK